MVKIIYDNNGETISKNIDNNKNEDKLENKNLIIKIPNEKEKQNDNEQ